MVRVIFQQNFFLGCKQSLHKRFLHFCVKKLRNRGTYPKFWVMPYDTVCCGIIENGFYERELLLGMQRLTQGTRDKGQGTRDKGQGTRDKGQGTRDKGQGTRVIAFEPVPRNCWILKSNLHLNRINNVTLIEKGLGDKAETLLFDDDPANTNNVLSEHIDAALAKGAITKVDVVCGDDELETLGIEGEISLIKVDVEGLEPKVLSGLGRTIQKHHPIIFWEAFAHETAEESVHILQSMGYQYFYHMTTNKYDSKMASKLANLLGKSTYLMPLAERKNLDGMNVAMTHPF